jgi:hypothetical protein
VREDRVSTGTPAVLGEVFWGFLSPSRRAPQVNMTVRPSFNHSTLYSPQNNQTLGKVKLLGIRRKRKESELIKKNSEQFIKVEEIFLDSMIITEKQKK